MRNSRDTRGPRTFRFTPGLGARLRELREAAGLSRVELCRVMDRSPGFQAHLGRLEAGRVPFPSLALVADYLRACRASFADILPALAEYTNRPRVRQTRIEERVGVELAGLPGREASRLAKYDLKRGGELRPDARVRAANRQARAARERRLLEAMMLPEVNRLGVRPTSAARLVALDYARMVWRAMTRTEASQKSEVEAKEPETRGKRGRPRKTREQRLKEARARILRIAPRILPAKALDIIRDKVVRLYEDTRRFATGDDAPARD